jgi:hypothetical protein
LLAGVSILPPEKREVTGSTPVPTTGEAARQTQALNPFTNGGNVVPIARGDEGDRARGARDEGEVG